MWIADQWQDYELLDCGGGEKLERWDKQYLVRPDPQAIWETPRRLPEWKRANARYLRSQTGGGHWEKKALPVHLPSLPKRKENLCELLPVKWFPAQILKPTYILPEH